MFDTQKQAIFLHFYPSLYLKAQKLLKKRAMLADKIEAIGKLSQKVEGDIAHGQGRVEAEQVTRLPGGGHQVAGDDGEAEEPEAGGQRRDQRTGASRTSAGTSRYTE